jgi:hypothetical protein
VEPTSPTAEPGDPPTTGGASSGSGERPQPDGRGITDDALARFDAASASGSGHRPAGLYDTRPTAAAGVAVTDRAKRTNAAAVSGRSARGRGGAWDTADLLVAVVAVLAATAASFADAHPVDWAPADVVMTAGFAALVTVATSKARRWTWLVLAGVTGLAARGGELLALAAVAVLLAFVGAALADRRGRLLGAFVGAVSIQVLLRLPELRYDGATALITALAVAPVLVSGYRTCRRRTRRRLRLAAAVVAGLAAVAIAGFVVTAIEARSQLQAAVDDGRAGLDAVRAGHQQDAVAQLDRSRVSFDAAQATLASPLARPARLVPVVGQHVRAARAMAAAGADLMTTASAASTSVRYDDLKTTGGQVNLPLLTSMAAPVDLTEASLARADAQLGSAASSWLLPPLAGPLNDFRDQVRGAQPDARLAANAVRVMPDLLGASGPRRYFVAFGTPAEARELGGFIGSYGELTAVDGKLSLTRSGSIQELSNLPGFENRSLTGMSAYLERYGRYQPARFLQNDSASPDFPQVAEALRQLYPQAGGQPVDGVIYVDPYGLAALLKLTGPVTVEGLGQPLTADNAAQFLLRDQYLTFAAASDARSDMLARATKATFEALTTRQLPGPKAIADALGPAAAEGRLMMTTFDGASRSFFEQLGSTGAFPAAVPGEDFLSLRTSNGGANKIDVFLHRSLDYAVRYDAATGAADITATVTLRNDAPASGLPDYVIGNTPSLKGLPQQPKGTNSLDLSLYAAGDLVDSTRDGQPIGTQNQVELGHHVYSVRVVLPPTSTTTLVFHLRAALTVGAYRLQVVPQPAVVADQLAVRVAAPGATVTGSTGWPVPPGPDQPAQLPSTESRLPRRLEVTYASAGT